VNILYSHGLCLCLYQSQALKGGR